MTDKEDEDDEDLRIPVQPNNSLLFAYQSEWQKRLLERTLAFWFFVLNDNLTSSKVWKRTIFLGCNIQDHTLCFATIFSCSQNKCRLPDSCNICMRR